MATFEATRGQLVQEHFEVLEVTLPVITGTCTIDGQPGFGTPLYCDEAWSGEYKTYKFTNTNAPTLPESNIYRCITNISETTTELKPAQGLSSRGSLRITFDDFNDIDPNQGAPGVTSDVISQGTFFGKLSIRQIVENKPVQLKLYRVEEDGTIDLVNGAEERNYITSSLTQTKSGTWVLNCKDVMFLANLEDKTWPIESDGFLRLDIDDTVTSIPVDGDTDYSSAVVVRISDEFLRVTSVSNNLTPTATLNVSTRGVPITAPVSGVRLTDTSRDSHTAGDEVFICDLSDDETIDSLLTRVLVDSDFDPSLIPSSDWADEVAEWHPLDKVNTLHSESEDVNDVLNRILNGYLMDLWFDSTLNEARLSAISVWKQSTTLLTEGKEINAYTIDKKANEGLRASRALVVYDKTNLSTSDEVASYKKASRFSNSQLIGEALYKEHKDKVFDNNFIIDTDAANLLTQRYVSRFGFTPYTRTMKVEERALDFKVGDVADMLTSVDVGPDGLPNQFRSQILQIKPVYDKEGRYYNVKTLSYEQALTSGSEIVIDTPLVEANLFILAGAPSQAVELTFVFDGSYSAGSLAIRAGQFSAGSKLIIILANGFDGQANGGTGGDGQSTTYEGEITQWLATSQPQEGEDGGVVFDAQGVDCDFYFSGATPSAAFPTADGYIRAPGGGGAGAISPFIGTDNSINYGGNSGGGGAGRNPATGGDAGDAESNVGNRTAIDGIDGFNGDIIGNGGLGGDQPATVEDGGNGGDWGMAGEDKGTKFGGLAGSGIIDNGGTVTLFGEDALRYINGNGDH